jgi:WD40 repeat protein
VKGSWHVKAGATALVRGLALAALLASCHGGGVAGTGAGCAEDDDCRFGYRCVERACQAVVEDEPDADQLEPDARAAADSAGEPDSALDIAAPDGGLAFDGSAHIAADGPPSSGPPSLVNCLTYLHPEHQSCASPHRSDDAPHASEFSPDGRIVVTASDDGKLRVWPVDRKGLSLPRVLSAGADALVLSSDGALVGTDGDPVGVLHLNSGMQVAAIPTRDPLRPAGSRLLAFSQDRQRAAVLDAAGVRVWSLTKGALEREITSVSFDQYGRQPSFEGEGHWWLVLLTASPSAAIVALDLNAAQPGPVPLVMDPGPIIAVRLALRADGKVLAVATMADGVWLWDVHDKAAPVRLVRVRPPEQRSYESVTDMAFSRSGRYLVLGAAMRQLDQGWTAGDLVIYDLGTNQPLFIRNLGLPPHRVAFSPDERAVVASVSECGTLLYCHD